MPLVSIQILRNMVSPFLHILHSLSTNFQRNKFDLFGREKIKAFLTKGNMLFGSLFISLCHIVTVFVMISYINILLFKIPEFFCTIKLLFRW